MTDAANQPFDGKVVLITGAGRGLGRALALSFSSAGARVAADDLTPINLDVTIQQIQAAGGQARAYYVDIAKGLPARGLNKQVMDEYGRQDILVNNAAVRPHTPILELDEWDWQRTLDVNLSGPFLLTQAAAEVMRAEGGGLIVNIAADPPEGEIPGEQAAFYASKAGLVAFSQAAAQELFAYNIRVHVICPGEMGRSLDPLLVYPAYRAVVERVLFLCSPEASHLNGEVIRLAGSCLTAEEKP